MVRRSGGGGGEYGLRGVVRGGWWGGRERTAQEVRAAHQARRDHSDRSEDGSEEEVRDTAARGERHQRGVRDTAVQGERLALPNTH